MNTPPTVPGPLEDQFDERPPWVGVLGIISIAVAGLTFLSAVYAPVQIFAMRVNQEMWADGRFEQLMTQTVQNAGSNAAGRSAAATATPPVAPDPRSATAATQPTPTNLEDDIQDSTGPAAVATPGPPPLNLPPNLSHIFDYPSWFETALAVRGALDLLLCGLLLFGGIQLLRHKPSYRPAHLIYAFLALVGMIAWVVTCALSKSIMSMTPAMCAVLLGLPYPIVVLVFMFGAERTAWYRGLRRASSPSAAA